MLVRISERKSVTITDNTNELPYSEFKFTAIICGATLILKAIQYFHTVSEMQV